MRRVELAHPVRGAHAHDRIRRTGSRPTQRISHISPTTGEIIGEIAVNTAEEVRERVAAARRVQPAFEALGFEARAAIMRRALSLLRGRAEFFAMWIGSERP